MSEEKRQKLMNEYLYDIEKEDEELRKNNSEKYDILNKFCSNCDLGIRDSNYNAKHNITTSHYVSKEGWIIYIDICENELVAYVKCRIDNKTYEKIEKVVHLIEEIEEEYEIIEEEYH